LQAQAVSGSEFSRQRGFIERIRALSDAFLYDTGRQKMALVQTFGCQQNMSDSEKIKGMLAEMGYAQALAVEDADIVILNTCAVREHAEQRVFGNVGALKPVKARRPSMIIGLCGCMMQQEHIAGKIKGSYPYVDLVFGTGALHRLPELLYQVMTAKRRVFALEEYGGIAEGLPIRRDGSIRAWLPISYGCNNFCTYCVVPYVRGRERSRQPEAVLEEARSLITEGYRDITLLGQNVNSYGADLENGYNFSLLLREINDMQGDFRIRFMTSHPKDLTKELIQTVAECEKVSKHIHLPFQAGSDRILKLMNRRYTKAAYLELVNSAKAAIPGLSLTSDVIVGFPGETYEDFLETVDIIKQVKFDNLYTFIYSKRRGTPAEKMPDDLPHEEKVRRFSELLAVQDEITSRRLKLSEGKTVRVLCEGRGKTGEGFMTGRTDAGTIVDFEAGDDAAGRFLNVEITQAKRLMLIGTVTE
jgi:tRNA-2-methylthio-N6-dimethylallyladenosine synthase